VIAGVWLPFTARDRVVVETGAAAAAPTPQGA
jgi:hypothetical protein